jgi:hypothetical protein
MTTVVGVEVVVCDTVVVEVVIGTVVAKASEVVVVVGVVIAQEQASLINDVGMFFKSDFSCDKELEYKLGE